MKLNFIQDIASPHNNVFAQAVNQTPDIDLVLWYCQEKPTMYDWKEDLNNAIKPAKMYKPTSVDLQFLKHCLSRKDEQFLIVGWQNINTKLLMILFFLWRRSYAVWFDLPNDERQRGFLKKAFRNFFYFILKHSNAHIFGVGQMTLDYFKGRGFNKNRLTNLPIFVDVSKEPAEYTKNKAEIYQKYNVGENDFFISAGSRLVYEKGFDILIGAIASLPEEVKSHIRCVIVGKGEEEQNLKQQIQQNNLTENIFLEGWMEFDDFSAVIANSHVFVHPCRFDAFGATIFGHAFGVPVLGNVGAGAAYDRIVDGENGYLFQNNDAGELANLIEKTYTDKDLLKTLGKSARQTALKWAPENAVDILNESFKQ